MSHSMRSSAHLPHQASNKYILARRPRTFLLPEPNTAPQDYVELGCAADPNPTADRTRVREGKSLVEKGNDVLQVSSGKTDRSKLFVHD